MSQERNLELIEEGREAAFVHGAVRDLVDNQMRVSITHLIAIYRNGKIDHDMLVGKVAEIAALEALMAELEARQQRAVVASNKEFGRDGKKA